MTVRVALELHTDNGFYVIIRLMAVCYFLSNTNDNMNSLFHYIDRSVFKGPWKLPQPVKILGVGNPIKDNCDPSVPPRIGSVLGTMSKASKTRLGISMMCFKGSIFLPC